MSATNRFMNRLVLAVVGVVTGVIGLGLIAVVSVPAVRDGWAASAPDVVDAVSSSLGGFALTLGQVTVDGVSVAVLLAIVIVVIALLAFIARHGGGRADTLVDGRPDAAAANGSIVVETGFASDLVSAELERHSEFLSAHVRGYSVKRTPTLLVSVTTRRGVSPAAAIALVERAATSLDAVLGVRIPVVAHLSGGFRSRVSKGRRTE